MHAAANGFYNSERAERGSSKLLKSLADGRRTIPTADNRFLACDCWAPQVSFLLMLSSTHWYWTGLELWRLSAWPMRGSGNTTLVWWQNLMMLAIATWTDESWSHVRSYSRLVVKSLKRLAKATAMFQAAVLYVKIWVIESRTKFKTPADEYLQGCQIHVLAQQRFRNVMQQKSKSWEEAPESREAPGQVAQSMLTMECTGHVPKRNSWADDAYCISILLLWNTICSSILLLRPQFDWWLNFLVPPQILGFPYRCCFCLSYT